MSRGRGRKIGAKNISQRVLKAIIAVKVLYPTFSAPQILKEIEKHRQAYRVNSDRLPSVGKTYSIIKTNRKEIENRQLELNVNLTGLDSEWTVGSCLKYNIPPEMVPILAEIQRVEREPSEVSPGIKLTVRQCRWIAFLYQAINSSELAKEQLPPHLLKGRVSIMADMYARREQLSEIMHLPSVDTSDLDEFFSNSEIDLLKLWLKTFDREQYEKNLQALDNFKPIPLANWMSLFNTNDLTQDDADVLNEWVRNYELLSQVEPLKASKADKQLRAQHPEIRPLFDFYLKFIEANKKDKVGDRVRLKDGRVGTILEIYPDGAYDIQCDKKEGEYNG